jgi:flagellar biosynthesis/type III secretory pathway protein FliH
MKKLILKIIKENIGEEDLDWIREVEPGNYFEDWWVSQQDLGVSRDLALKRLEYPYARDFLSLTRKAKTFLNTIKDDADDLLEQIEDLNRAVSVKSSKVWLENVASILDQMKDYSFDYSGSGSEVYHGLSSVEEFLDFFGGFGEKYNLTLKETLDFIENYFEEKVTGNIDETKTKKKTLKEDEDSLNWIKQSNEADAEFIKNKLKHLSIDGASDKNLDAVTNILQQLNISEGQMEILGTVLSRVGTEITDSAYDSGLNAGWEEGHREGYNEGQWSTEGQYDEGYDEGYADAERECESKYDDGYDDGKEEGYKEGYTDGKEEVYHIAFEEGRKYQSKYEEEEYEKRQDPFTRELEDSEYDEYMEDSLGWMRNTSEHGFSVKDWLNKPFYEKKHNGNKVQKIIKQTGHHYIDGNGNKRDTLKICDYSKGERNLDDPKSVTPVILRNCSVFGEEYLQKTFNELISNGTWVLR